MKMRVVDLFAGCGGLSHGFVRAGKFDVVLGTDIDERALETFAHNHAKYGSHPILIPGDITAIKPREFVSQLESLGLDAPGSVDLLVGGPPCEGFSQNRRHEVRMPDGSVLYTRNPLDSRDPRNTLFRYYLNLADKLRPRAVLIENVPQMATSHNGKTIAEISRRLTGMGYEVQWSIMNAADYGVPQARKRAFIVGLQRGLRPFEWPSVTHSKSAARQAESGVLPYVTVRDAIADLPDPTTRELGRRGTRHYKQTVSGYALAMRSDTSTPMNHVVRIPSEQVLRRLRAMKPGMISADLPDHLKTKSAYYNCYGRLSWDAPAKTITKSCNYLGSGCFGHPTDDRGITMREAARLQSFDDDFDFVSKSEPHVAKMIGSAVPPLLAQHIAESLAKSLEG